MKDIIYHSAAVVFFFTSVQDKEVTATEIVCFRQTSTDTRERLDKY